MACMEHACGSCGNIWATNTKAVKCPKCESSDVANWWDEQDLDHELLVDDY